MTYPNADERTAEVISSEAFEALRKLDDVVREEARRIHAEHNSRSDYQHFTLQGAYDNSAELVALRSAIRRGIEIGSMKRIVGEGE